MAHLDPAGGEDRRFLAGLLVGEFRWPLVCPFPDEDPADRRRGDRLVADIGRFVTATVDPQEVDETRRLPDAYVAALHEHGYLALTVESERGGLGLPAFTAFRMISAAMSWSIAAAYVIAIHNGQGVPAILPAIPPGLLRDLSLRRLAEGAISGWADTEVTGAANDLPATTARTVERGRAYVLDGHKVFIGNGQVAGEMIVTATLQTATGPQACLFVVDARDPGFRVDSTQDLLSFHGLPLAAITLDNVRVPAERLLLAPDTHWRLAPLLEPIAALGRLHIISGAALATGRLCLRWSRDFVGRRLVDGRGLGEYDEIQRLLSASLADVFAMETVAHWCLLGDDTANLSDRYHEWLAAKNISSMTCWRLVDRTISLLAAEGLETAASKQRRGVGPVPLERYFRDVRGLRVAGGVDFHVDQRAAGLFLRDLYYPQPVTAETGEPDLGWLAGVSLSDRNRDHLAHVARQTRRLARTCRQLVGRHPDPETLDDDAHTLIGLNRIAGEMFTMAVVLARAAGLRTAGDGTAEDLADVFCTGARLRLATLWLDLESNSDPSYPRLARGFLSGDGMDFLLRDLVEGADVTGGDGAGRSARARSTSRRFP